MICNPSLSAWHILFHFSPLCPGPKGQLRFKSRERSISVLFPRLQTSKMQYMNCFKHCERLTWMCLRTSLSLASYLSCFYRLLTLLQMFSPEASFSATQPLSQNTPAHWKSWMLQSWTKPSFLLPPPPHTLSPPSPLGLLVLFDALQMGSGASGFRILYAEGRRAFRWNRLAVLSPLCLKRHRAGSTIPNRLFRLICKNIYLLTFAARCTRPQSGVFSPPPCLAVAVYSAG